MGWQFAALQIICKFRGKIFCKLAFWLTVDFALLTGGKNICRSRNKRNGYHG